MPSATSGTVLPSTTVNPPQRHPPLRYPVDVSSRKAVPVEHRLAEHRIGDVVGGDTRPVATRQHLARDRLRRTHLDQSRFGQIPAFNEQIPGHGRGSTRHQTHRPVGAASTRRWTLVTRASTRRLQEMTVGGDPCDGLRGPMAGPASTTRPSAPTTNRRQPGRYSLRLRAAPCGSRTAH